MREQSGTRAAPPPPGRPRPGLPRPAAPPCSPLRCSGSVFRFVCSWVVLTPGYDFTCVPFNLSFYRWRHGHVLSRLEILTPAPGECTLESRSPLACPTSSPRSRDVLDRVGRRIANAPAPRASKAQGRGTTRTRASPPPPGPAGPVGPPAFAPGLLPAAAPTDAAPAHAARTPHAGSARPLRRTSVARTRVGMEAAPRARVGGGGGSTHARRGWRRLRARASGWRRLRARALGGWRWLRARALGMEAASRRRARWGWRRLRTRGVEAASELSSGPSWVGTAGLPGPGSPSVTRAQPPPCRGPVRLERDRTQGPRPGQLATEVAVATAAAIIFFSLHPKKQHGLVLWF